MVYADSAKSQSWFIFYGDQGGTTCSPTAPTCGPDDPIYHCHGTNRAAVWSIRSSNAT
jgi:hypothetical protein